MKYKYLLFDADNTLFDFDKAEKNAFLSLNSVIPGAFSLDGYSPYHKINKALWKSLERGEITKSELKIKRFGDYLDSVGLTCEHKTINDVAAAYLSALSRESILMDGVTSTLEYLASKYLIYIVTNGISTVQRPRLSASEINKYIKDVFISEEIGYEKPDKRFFDHVLSCIGDTDTEAYLVIGDSISSDINGAKFSGIDAVYFAPDSISNNESGAKYNITSISELKDLL